MDEETKEKIRNSANPRVECLLQNYMNGVLDNLKKQLAAAKALAAMNVAAPMTNLDGTPFVPYSWEPEIDLGIASDEDCIVSLFDD